MSDYITREERRLIDEAIAAGRVRVMPPATYSEGYWTPDSWKEMHRKTWEIGKARGVQERAKKLAQELGPPVALVEALAVAPVGSYRHEGSNDTDRRIVELLARGFTHKKIAAEIGLASGTVSMRIKRMKDRKGVR